MKTERTLYFFIHSKNSNKVNGYYKRKLNSTFRRNRINNIPKDKKENLEPNYYQKNTRDLMKGILTWCQYILIIFIFPNSLKIFFKDLNLSYPREEYEKLMTFRYRQLPESCIGIFIDWFIEKRFNNR